MKKDSEWVLPLTFLIAAIIVGAFVYHYLEGWNLLDSFYFVIMTMTTVGYGDFVPITDAGKIFTMVFAVVGVGSALYFFSLAGSSIFKRHVAQLKSNVKKQEEVKEDIREARSRKKKSVKRKK